MQRLGSAPRRAGKQATEDPIAAAAADKAARRDAALRAAALAAARAAPKDFTTAFFDAAPSGVSRNLHHTSLGDFQSDAAQLHCGPSTMSLRRRWHRFLWRTGGSGSKRHRQSSCFQRQPAGIPARLRVRSEWCIRSICMSREGLKLVCPVHACAAASQKPTTAGFIAEMSRV